jgi:hypothetical protein
MSSNGEERRVNSVIAHQGPCWECFLTMANLPNPFSDVYVIRREHVEHQGPLQIQVDSCNLTTFHRRPG